MTSTEHPARIAKLQEHLSAQGLDGALLHGVTNLYYFSGTAQQAHLWVPASGEAVLLVRRVLERARAESDLDRVEGMRSLRELAGRLGGAKRIGMELDIMPVQMYGRYEKAVPGLDAADIGATTRLLRARKSVSEIDVIRRTAAAAAAAFAEVPANLRVGMSELDLAIVLEGAERRNGFQGTLRWRASAGFECPWVHVLAGPSALDFSFADTPFGGCGITPAAPYGAGDALIRADQPVCVDFAMARNGYIHDMTRTLVVGTLPDELLAAYDVCRDMMSMIVDEARPGVTGETLWNRCATIADEAGLADHFMGFGAQKVRFVGHGVGLELDELPVLAPRQSMELEVGHVIAVEPKMFFPGVGAVGLENTFAVYDGGIEKLTPTSDDLIVL